MHVKKSSWLKHLDFVILDLLCINISFVLAYYLRLQRFDFYIIRGYRMLAVIAIILHLLIIFFSNYYSGILRRGYLREASKVFLHNMILMGGIVSYLFLLQVGQNYSRTILAGFFCFNTILTYLSHIVLKQIRMHYGILETKQQKLLILSTAEEVESVEKFKNGLDKSYQVVGIALDKENKELTKIAGIPVVACGNEIYNYACRNVIDGVFVNASLSDQEKMSGVINKFVEMGITVYVKMDALISGSFNVSFGRLDSTNVMIAGMKTVTAGEMFCKRVLDICAGIVGCLITAVLFVFVAPAIKIADPKGPVFFGQERAGKNGRKFKIYKFRSMYTDAEERKKDLMEKNKMDGLMFKIDADPRIIGSGPDGNKKGLGHFLRASSIDEFPNFWSILKGDMSLVGTRPPTLDEYERYELHHKSRLATKPGLTGLWQVSGRSDFTNFEEVVKLDNEYIKNWSLGLDIKIILKTVLVVLTRKGSV